jgi:translation initiation factor 4E
MQETTMTNEIQNSKDNSDYTNKPLSLSSMSTTTIPLHSKWTMWFDNPRLAPPGSDWKDNLKVCGDFDNVEMFWRIYNNLKPPTQISMNSNYSVFRYGIEPSWEDPLNCDGGKFVLTIPKKTENSATNQKCDEYWLFTVLAVIGETMDVTGNIVCGAVFSFRKNQHKIALWLKSSDKMVCTAIGERWKKVLNLEKEVLRYQTHRDAAASGRSFRNEVQFAV